MSPQQAGVRPFLPSSRQRRESADLAEAVGVRGYVITGGRASAPLAYETILTSVRNVEWSSQQFERARIMQLCAEGEALSVAEIAAKLALPIGVIRVLASDLVSAGCLIAHEAGPDQSSDVSLITRLIHGVRSL